MMQLLFMVLLFEAVLVLLLLFKIHIRELLLEQFDALKQGKLPLILRTISGILLAVFLSSVYSVIQILRRRSIIAGSIDLPDQVLLSEKILQASLAGILLFLGVVINQLYPLIREESSIKNIIKAENKQIEKMKLQIDTQLKAFKNEIVKLKPNITKLELDHKTKIEKAMAAEITASALKKQAEELYVEYDRLLDYNQTLRNQLQSIDEVLLEDNDRMGSSNWRSNECKEVGFDKELVASSRCDRNIFSSGSPAASPRHRRPIYQH